MAIPLIPHRFAGLNKMGRVTVALLLYAQQLSRCPGKVGPGRRQQGNKQMARASLENSEERQGFFCGR
jgi:hypothetical protein